MCRFSFTRFEEQLLNSVRGTKKLIILFCTKFQEDFEEFSDVDELYISLPLEKVESLEDLVTIPPGLVKVNYMSYTTLIAEYYYYSVLKDFVFSLSSHQA